MRIVVLPDILGTRHTLSYDRSSGTIAFEFDSILEYSVLPQYKRVKGLDSSILSGYEPGYKIDQSPRRRRRTVYCILFDFILELSWARSGTEPPLGHFSGIPVRSYGNR